MKLSGPIDIIKKSIELYFEKNNLVYFLKIYSALIPFAIISIFQNEFIKSGAITPSWQTSFFAITGLGSLIIYFLVGLAGIYGVMGVVSNKTLSVREAYKNAWGNIWKFSLLAILLFFIVMGGIILLVIPGIIFGIWFSFSRFIFVEKNTGIKESLSLSKALVVGRFWPIFGRLFVFGLFGVLVQIIFGILPFGIGSILTTIIGALFIFPPYLLYKELSA